MRLVTCYSHLNGLEYLQVHHPNLWKEIRNVVDAVDATACRTKVSKEKRKEGRKLYSPRAMNAAFRSFFAKLGWKESRTSYWVTSDAKLVRATLHLSPGEQRKKMEGAGVTPIRSHNQTDFVKDRVAVEVQFGKYAFVAYDLFVKHLAFFVSDIIDVGVEILPMRELQMHMSSGVSHYEGQLYNVIREGRGNPPVPLVIIGVAP